MISGATGASESGCTLIHWMITEGRRPGIQWITSNSSWRTPLVWGHKQCETADSIFSALHFFRSRFWNRLRRPLHRLSLWMFLKGTLRHTAMIWLQTVSLRKLISCLFFCLYINLILILHATIRTYV